MYDFYVLLIKLHNVPFYILFQRLLEGSILRQIYLLLIFGSVIFLRQSKQNMKILSNIRQNIVEILVKNNKVKLLRTKHLVDI